MPLPNPVRCTKKPRAKASSSSSKSKPRLPPDLQSRILLAFFDNLFDQGGIRVDEKLFQLSRLSLVCREWSAIVRPEYVKWVAFELRMKGMQRDGGKQPFDAEIIEAQLNNLRQARCLCCYSREGLRIALDNPSGTSLVARERIWKKALEKILVEYRKCPQFQLDLADAESGEYVDIIWRFIRLEKLHIAATRAHARAKIRLHSPSSSPNSSTTLTRLDLFSLDIISWHVIFPAMKTVTLHSIRFRTESEGGTTEIISRDFFDSFPNLKALGLEGLKGISPCAFSRFKMFSITHLYLGSCTVETAKHCPDCLGSDPLVVPLSRYFRSQIKHLILSPNEASRPLLESLLKSRTDKSHPSYLNRLESVQLALPIMPNIPDCEDYCEWAQGWREESRVLVEEALREAKLPKVEVSYREEVGPFLVSAWEPFY